MAIAQRKKTRNADNINKVEDEHIKDEKTIFLYSKAAQYTVMGNKNVATVGF